MKNLILSNIVFVFMAITFHSCQVNTPTQTNNSRNLSGTWTGVGYQCPWGTFHNEIIDIQQRGNQLVATKITGDECVTAGNITFKATYNQNPFSATFAGGLPHNPNSASSEYQLTVVHPDTIVVKDLPLVFVRRN